MKKLIECVPNFSEGRDRTVIKQITDEIEKVEGVKLFDVDPGAATNRTVVTFVGTPDEVVEAAFRAVKKAAEVIDMRNHKGEHPRFGATDVCPLVPVSNITMEETVEYARKLAQRIGEELEIPVYCYENAAFTEERRNLANCRSGEYEGLAEKLADPHWKPDFGPAEFNEKVAGTGATAVGARDFLVAFNVNLNTTSTRRANAIAFDVRERGRVKREGNPITGKIVKDENGNPVYIPGSLKAVKAIGWYIEEYGIAQISMNLTNISITPVHVAFDEVCKKADARGIRVTGSELVGLIPLEAMLEAGRYFLRKQKRSLGVDRDELLKIAIKSLGLDDLKPFNPKERIIEFLLEEPEKKLVDMSLTAFANETASESPAPGGGSISAYVGALGASLGTMVANLSAHKRGWDDRWEEFSDWAEKGQQYKDELLHLVDEDTRAFNRIMEAFGLPKKTEEEKKARSKAIEEASKYAMEIPLKVMETAYNSIAVMRAMAENGNPNSVSDAGVGALCAVTAVEGAYLNVKINAMGIHDKQFTGKLLQQAEEILEKARGCREMVLETVNEKINSL
ncbi:glutamate formimidoyltransferase [Candidatus Sulfidibacterium hydrothermale]|uniref:glutamate formimidoyltransferase n=1 Tax=Candidatus Sulfidibacterium hydrothermale TaxID=2875962 RepID=UPI001F0A8A52|nr:glutamate formimidoyltransferase [Candidatus Sulfidibacterium hydrothermale]UBM62951.1 glutamate formimidoyltransferase [Candidatus Sulfidibacterium hydrothermale]